MAVLAVIVAVAVGGISTALARLARSRTITLPAAARRPALAIGCFAAIAAVAIALLAGAPGEVSDRWQEFKAPAGPSEDVSRFDSASGNGRYQWWSAAVDAGAAEPVGGLGPGSFEFYWLRAGDEAGFVRDAHSLYLESFAELGIPGVMVIGAFVLGLTGFGVRRAFDREDPHRAELAGASAACATFAAAAAIDWVWELAVVSVVFLLLAAAILAPPRVPPAGRSRGVRLTLAALAAVGLATVSVPLLAADAWYGTARQAPAPGDSPEAIARADDARSLEPWAATPWLQLALVNELAGDFDAAALAAREATEREPTNWRPWLVLSRARVIPGRDGGRDRRLRAGSLAEPALAAVRGRLRRTLSRRRGRGQRP